jgi:hypothetical protein
MMKTLVIASGISLSLMLFPLAQAAEPGTAPMEQPMMGKKGERHPEMHRALHALQNAKHDLEHAAHDYGGHRAKAVELTNQAINEIKEGLEYDRKEEKGKK